MCLTREEAARATPVSERECRPSCASSGRLHANQPGMVPALPCGGSEAVALFSTRHTIEALGGGETLVAHIRAMMKHIERVSKPILEKITPESAAVWPPLQQYQAEWAQLQAGLNSNSVSDRKICSNTPAEHFFWCETAACKNSVVRPCSKTV